MPRFRTRALQGLALLLLALIPGGAYSVDAAMPLALDGLHRFHEGDDPLWSEADFDDSAWTAIRVPGSADGQGLAPAEGRGWYRIHFKTPSAWTPGAPAAPDLAVALGIVWGADETWLNGTWIGGTGTLGWRPAYPYLVDRVYAIPSGLLRAGDNVLAIRIQNGVDVWGLVNGPVVVGPNALLVAQAARRAQPFYALDAVLLWTTLVALGVWAFFLVENPRDPTVRYLGAGLAGLFYFTLVGSLPFYEAGGLSRWTTTFVPPAITIALPFFVVAALYFVSNRPPRALGALPPVFAMVTLAWIAWPDRRLNIALTNGWQLLCLAITLLFLREAWLGWRRRRAQSGLILAASIASLAIGIAAAVSAKLPDPPDWTMRYAVLACFWVLPAFLLVGLVQRQVHTRRRMLELSAQVLHAGSEERRRLSRELHDGVAQNLQAAKLGLQRAAHGQLAEHAVYEQAVGLVTGSIDELRCVAQDLRPLQPGRSSLHDALARYTEILGVRSGLQISLDDHRGSAIPNDPPDRAEHLYRIAQEAIGNAVRHARARRIRITLSCEGQGTRLCVEDDGIGFDPERARRAQSGIGL